MVKKKINNINKYREYIEPRQIVTSHGAVQRWRHEEFLIGTERYPGHRRLMFTECNEAEARAGIPYFDLPVIAACDYVEPVRRIREAGHV